MDFSAISSATSSWAGMPTPEGISSRGTVLASWSPSASLISRSRRAERSMRASGIRPSHTAFTIPSTAASTDGGMSTTSAPASTACTAASPVPRRPEMARMSMASVKRRPSKPISRRSTPLRTAADRVAGSPLPPLRAGTVMWAVMTAPMPASMAAWKGRSSTESMRARSWGMVGRARWESVSVSPWPGKCLPHARTEALPRPRAKARA